MGLLAVDHVLGLQVLVVFVHGLQFLLVLLAPRLEIGIGVLQKPFLLHGLLPFPEVGVAVLRDHIHIGLSVQTWLRLGIMILSGLVYARLACILSMLDFIMLPLDLQNMTVTPRLSAR